MVNFLQRKLCLALQRHYTSRRWELNRRIYALKEKHKIIFKTHYLKRNSILVSRCMLNKKKMDFSKCQQPNRPNICYICIIFVFTYIHYSSQIVKNTAYANTGIILAVRNLPMQFLTHLIISTLTLLTYFLHGAESFLRS